MTRYFVPEQADVGERKRGKEGGGEEERERRRGSAKGSTYKAKATTKCRLISHASSEKCVVQVQRFSRCFRLGYSAISLLSSVPSNRGRFCRILRLVQQSSSSKLPNLRTLAVSEYIFPSLTLASPISFF